MFLDIAQEQMFYLVDHEQIEPTKPFWFAISKNMWGDFLSQSIEFSRNSRHFSALLHKTGRAIPALGTLSPFWRKKSQSFRHSASLHVAKPAGTAHYCDVTSHPKLSYQKCSKVRLWQTMMKKLQRIGRFWLHHVNQEVENYKIKQ